MKLFLPLEVVNREYASRLLVAAEAARRGVEVIFGHKGQVLNSALSQTGSDSVWLGRGSISPELLSRGYSLAGHDEEAGLIYDNYRDYYEQRPGLKSISSAHKFFCWGPDDHGYLTSQHSHKESNIAQILPLCGSPRAALWGSLGIEFYKNEIQKIKQKYGGYILIVSNFAIGNSILGNSISDHIKELGNWDKMNHLVRSASEKENRLLPFFAHCAKGLAREFKLKVVIRPHPVESATAWRKAVKDTTNVHVVTGGDLTPWILASRAIIHNSCTSGIEAACAGVPAVALGEKYSDLESSGASFSNSLSLTAIGEQHLYEVFDDIDSAWQANNNYRSAMLNRKLFQYGNQETIQKIVTELFNIQIKEGRVGFRVPKTGIVDQYGLAKQKIISWLPPISAKQRLCRQKRPVMELERLNKDLMICSAIINSGSMIKAYQLKPNIFKISL